MITEPFIFRFGLFGEGSFEFIDGDNPGPPEIVQASGNGSVSRPGDCEAKTTPSREKSKVNCTRSRALVIEVPSSEIEKADTPNGTETGPKLVVPGA